MTKKSSTNIQAKSVSKKDRILTALRKENGASIAELCELTDWQAHSVRGFLAGTVKKRLRLPLVSKKSDDGIRRYRIKQPKKTS